MDRTVGRVIEIATPVAPALLAGGERRSRIAIHIEGNRSAVLDMDNPRAAAHLQLLKELADAQLPVCIWSDAGVIKSVTIPLVVKVRSLSDLGNGDVGVDLQPSHVQHTLLAGHPHYDQMLEALNAARLEQRFVAVTETTRHDILDVTRTAPPALDWSDKPLLKFAFVDFVLPEALVRALPTVTQEEASDLFDAMVGKGCDGDGNAPQCIPFLYPDDGCHARAHRMCEVMLRDHHIRAGKIWLFGRSAPASVSLRVRTRNHPDCPDYVLPWRYHVAPFLNVEVDGQIEPRVIDPALFRTIVPPATWKSKQGDPHARFSYTNAGVWDRPEPSVVLRDNDFSRTPADLRDYRLRLKARIIEFGPPPYC